MALPKPEAIQKKQDFKESLENSLVDGKMPTKKICSILRSNIRKTWMMCPIRLLKLEKARIADMDPSTRTQWLCECEYCHDKFKMTDVQTDHIKGEHQLKELSDVAAFATSILDVTLDDLQILCKGCHSAKTYSDRYKMPIEDAFIELKVIAWCKKTKTPKQTEFLLAQGLQPSTISNAIKRKDAYRKYLTEK